MSGKKEHKMGGRKYRQEKKWKLSEEDQGVDKRARKDQHTTETPPVAMPPQEQMKKDEEGESSSHRTTRTPPTDKKRWILTFDKCWNWYESVQIDDINWCHHMLTWLVWTMCQTCMNWHESNTQMVDPTQEPCNEKYIMYWCELVQINNTLWTCTLGQSPNKGKEKIINYNK